MGEADFKDAMSKEFQLLRAEAKSSQSIINAVTEEEEASRTKICAQTEALVGVVEQSRQMQEVMLKLQDAAKSEKLSEFKERINKALEIKDFDSIKKILSEIQN